MDNNPDPFDGLIELFRTFLLPDHLWQIPVLFAALLTGLAASTVLGRRLREDHTLVAEEAKRLRGILFASVTAVALWLLQREWGHGRVAPLLHMALALALTLSAARLGVLILHHVTHWSRRARLWQTFFVRSVWVVFALHITGFLDPLLDLLGDLGFTVGTTHLSLLQILQGGLLLTVMGVGALWLGAGLERRLMREDSLDTHVRIIVVKLMRGLILLLAVLLALPMMGVDATLLSVLGGALGVGLGLALQKVASNYVSGFIILFDRSIRMGDVLTVEGRIGTVIRLDARCITLSGTDGTAFIVPNETFMTQTIINHTRMGTGVCHGMALEVVYGTDIKPVVTLMEAAARRQSRILTEPPPGVAMTRSTGHGMELTLYYWIADPGVSDTGLRSALLTEMLQGLRDLGVEIPLKDSVQRVRP